MGILNVTLCANRYCFVLRIKNNCALLPLQEVSKQKYIKPSKLFKYNYEIESGVSSVSSFGGFYHGL